MPVHRELLRQALSELVQRKSCAENPTRFRAQLYGSALTEWAGQFGGDHLKLDRFVHVRGAVSGHSLIAAPARSALTVLGFEHNSPSSAGDQLDTPLRNGLGLGLALP
jgi:hypothetical protein